MKKLLTVLVFSVAMIAVLTSCANKSVSVEKDSQVQMTGAYREGHDVSKEEINLFKDTYKGDVALTPVSVYTQVVAGTNYMFICKDKEGNKYKVVIYQ